MDSHLGRTSFLSIALFKLLFINRVGALSVSSQEELEFILFVATRCYLVSSNDDRG